jgi:hypothetical protein
VNKVFYCVPEVRTNKVVVSELKDELLIYCLVTNQAYCLNKTAAAVYQSADGIKSVKDIAHSLSRELKSPVTEEFVLFSLNELKSQNLVKFSTVAEPPPAKQSRREVIKKIGLSTAIALPIITMLSAPKAADAQSACGDLLDACTGGGSTPPFAQGSCCSGFNCCPNNQCYPTGICPA